MITPEKLIKPLAEISKNTELREEFVFLLKKFEAQSIILDRHYNVRELITGPIIDILFKPTEIIEKKLMDGTTFRFRNGSKITRDFILSEPSVTDHVWEPQTTRLLKLLATNAEHIIIGGAYIGDHAILLAKEIESDCGIVHAFEPDISSREMLTVNANLNNVKNIRINEKCLWSESNQYFLLKDDDALSNVAMIEEGLESNISSISIDDYCFQNDIKNVGLILIDVEGAEFEVIKGAKGLFNMRNGVFPNIIFEIHSQYVDWSEGIEHTEFCRYLTNLGYRLYAIRDFHSNHDTRTLDIEIIPLENCYLEGPPHGFNVLAITNDSIITELNLKIVKNVSPKLLLHKDARYHHPIKHAE